MRSWLRAGVVALLALGAARCSAILGREYEYEEQVYLAADGSAVVVVDSSVPALVALRGLPLDPATNARIDRTQLRNALTAAGCQVTRLPEPWRRHGRRFVQIRIAASDVRDLAHCSLLGWSTYAGLATLSENAVHYHQVVGPPASADPGAVNWTGDEIVGFKLHLPSRILENSARRLDAAAVGEIERGNILTWEQRLADRRAGVPITIDVTMDRESILSRTLWLFAGAVVAAVTTLALAYWWITRRGRAIAPVR